MRPTSDLPHAWIAGCGDVGTRLAQQLMQAGGTVTALIRDPAKAAPLQALGADVQMMDLDMPRSVGDVPWLFWLAPPPAQGVTDTRLRGWLAAQHGHIGRVVLVSTSGVYGDCQGRWIDEDEPLKPQTPRAQRRVDAEAALAQWAAQAGTQWTVLRVPGIYAVNRLPRERLARGMVVLREADAPWTNRIHADDLAAALALAAARAPSGRIYNIADGNPTTMSDYFIRCAAHLGLPVPTQVDWPTAQQQMTAEMRSYLDESRRLRVDRVRDELGFVPRYCDLAHGLAAGEDVQCGTFFQSGVVK